MGEQTLAARERPGSDYLDTLTSRNNLAIAYRDADRTIEQNNNVKPANILAPAGTLLVNSVGNLGPCGVAHPFWILSSA